ncbi:MAG TPA: M55 family metallopeptidase [Gemmatimonadales bacterium]|jgi:D-amino peptidase|nr:M55 family metallopeptidase [Gemmatimonadales bacterium]
MRVYISVDMEGVAGIVHEDQTNPVDPRCAGEYSRGRRLMTAEANAAIEGALAAGAAYVLVNDSHWLMRNILADELDQRAELMSGDPKRLSMMEGIEAGFDAAVFIGYHARAGTALAMLDHTMTDELRDVRLNGRSVGEIGLNAALAGAYGVPVAFVSGDRACADEAREFLGPDVQTLAVKHAVSRSAARSLPPAVACRQIRDGVAAALGRRHEPVRIASPATIEVDLTFTHQADYAELVPGAVRRGPLTVSYTHADYKELFRAFRAIYNLARVN